MKKSTIYWLIIALGILLPAVFWLLSEMPSSKDAFGAFNFAWFLTISSGTLAACLIVKGTVDESTKSYQKVYILSGAIIASVAVLAFVSAIAWPDKVWIPLLVVVLAICFLGGVLFTQDGKKWDQGDNHKEGYKNYRQRKDDDQK
ncbi:MAG: hypothetical protein LBU60_04255 [Clostridiales bacterium]|jgi:hypothetical protein|nr:hypothetical protein [Clostridiales bacterium]